MLDNVVTTLIETVTGGIELFFTTIKYLVYPGIIAVPLVGAYKIGEKFYSKYF